MLVGPLSESIMALAVCACAHHQTNKFSSEIRILSHSDDDHKAQVLAHASKIYLFFFVFSEP